MGSSFETNVEVYSIRWRSDHDLGYHAKCRDLNLLLAYMDFFRTNNVTIHLWCARKDDKLAHPTHSNCDQDVNQEVVDHDMVNDVCRSFVREPTVEW